MLGEPVTQKPTNLRIFVDSDVLFAGCAAPTDQSASLVILGLAEITLIDAFISEQVFEEVSRNLADKFRQAVPSFNLIVQLCLTIVPDPTFEELESYDGLAHTTDLPILAAAHREGCPYLVSFNLRHYRPGHPEVAVLRPGDLVLRVRDLLTRL
jgi:hypothetical protein